MLAAVPCTSIAFCCFLIRSSLALSTIHCSQAFRLNCTLVDLSSRPVVSTSSLQISSILWLEMLVCYRASLYCFYSTPLTCMDSESQVRRLHLTWRWCCERAEADPPLKAQSCHDRWMTAARTSSLRWTPGSCCAAGRCPGRWVWTWAAWRSDSWRKMMERSTSSANLRTQRNTC